MLDVKSQDISIPDTVVVLCTAPDEATAQELAAKNGFRPSNPDILRRYADRFDLKVKLTKISDFGGWEAAYVKFFNDDALFDKIMADVNGDA